jgi:hypothetical protein
MKTTTKVLKTKMKSIALAALAVAALASTAALAGNKDEDEFKFKLVRNTQFDAQFPNFAPNARGRVKIESVGPVEIMDVKVWGLPPNTDFDFFVIQVPHAPFGLAWYQGDRVHLNKRHKSSTGLTMVNESAVTSVFAAIEPARVYVGLLAVRRQPEFSCNLPSATMLALFSSPLL